MPELPEVETVRRQIAPLVQGRTIVACRVVDDLLLRDRPRTSLTRSLNGRTIQELGRCGKYLILALDNGHCVALHLRMTGMLEPFAGKRPPHTRLVLELDNNRAIAFTDTRRFGTLDIFASAEDLDEYLAARLGAEPIAPDWTVDALHAALRRRSTPIKSALLDQRIGNGLGNIYADEALFHARINPYRSANSLDYRESAMLAAACRRVLLDAIEAGGSNIRDYVPPGTTASYQEQHHAYGRGGLPCRECGATMHKGRIGGRATVHCPSCQSPRPLRRPKV